VRDAGVVDEHVETAELVLDALCCSGDAGLIRDVELDGSGIRADALRSRLPALEVARPDEDGEAVRREIRRDLKADSLLAPVTRATGLSCILRLLCG
jgi:hypothetical protein